MNFAFHGEARSEYRAAAEYYEQRQSGLGKSFSTEIEATLSRILESPSRWPLVGNGVRRCRTRKFPYGIIYKLKQNEQKDSVFILAVMHGSRKPGYWKDRLS